MINLLGLGRKTSGYGNRDNPTGSGNDNHKGLDLVLHNDNIPAVMGGTVTYVGYAGNAGNMVTIKSNDGYIHKYMHLASPSTLKVGQTVTEGQTIGIQGSTGRSTGKHLHFQVEYSDGSGTIDPEKYLAGATGNVAYIDTIQADGTSGGFGLKDNLLDLAGKVIQFLAILLIIIIVIYLFMKAFDISII